MAKQSTIIQDTPETDYLLTMKEKDLLDKLAVRHPLYAELSAQAKQNLDIYSEERSRIVNSNYIPQGSAENETDYKKRLELTEAIPETPGIVAKVAGAVFEPDPEHQMPEAAKNYLINADKYGATHTQVMLDVFSKALVCGQMLVYVDTTMNSVMASPDRPLSQAEAEQLGARVILSVYDPRNILNWHYDERGLAWVLLLDSQKSQSSFIDDIKTVDDYLLIDRQTAYKFSVVMDGKEQKIVDRQKVVHDLGECPCEIFTFINDREKGQGVGKVFVRSSVRADLAALRIESGKAMVMQIFGNPQLFRRFSQDEWDMINNSYVMEMAAQGKGIAGGIDYTYIGNRIKLGYNSYHILKGQESEIGYATLDVGPLDKMTEAADRYRALAQRKAGFESADIWGQAQKVNAESGISKAFSYSMKEGTQLELLSMIQAMHDTKVLKLVCRRMGANPDEAMANYPQPRMVAPFGALQTEYDFMDTANYPEEILKKARQQIFGRLQLFDGMDIKLKAELSQVIAEQKEEFVQPGIIDNQGGQVNNAGESAAGNQEGGGNSANQQG